ncbi:MAG: transcriptional repressor [Puniceicoccales bacterium]|nr:transcriptional repressor [Puniceicoccales bacterium]
MHREHEHHCCDAGEHSGELYVAAIERLREHSLRITEPRKAMLHALADYRRPVSVEELHKEVGEKTADIVTIYRSIEAFERIGVVQRHPLESGKNLYELSMAANHHHHVICRTCGRIDPLDGCVVDRFEAAARKLGYTKLSHVFEVYGVCENCVRVK